MAFSVSTWNINSVRLRLPLVLDFLRIEQPDMLCLQETKCPDGNFPVKALQAAGYQHLAISGQKGYHGAAILSRLPFEEIDKRRFCDLNDCRHISVVVQAGGKCIRVHNFYVPAGGDEPDPQNNPKFAHKLQFLNEMKTISADTGDGCSALLVGDLNIAPLENDVWSHKQLLKIVSHTPVETEGLQEVCRLGGWVDFMREKIPPGEKLYTWWSYRAKDWITSNRGRRLDHIWGSADLVPALEAVSILAQARGWEKPSDHVPVTARFSFD
ncbi:MAG: Exodeoxyribonuclease III [Candidatus Tokpelaia hoelldobleri]|uniref:Exodeoxyribonuclease III n=1 Tax=Candidatus Tokpelaia hoelldobleri TaxID=1902579 RepID=A0A1U9JWI3_9HYPH|nr:MAG: Exodeoxyribonuclease III [Candidatus Tokpelaia hoelldoblerii]